MWGALGKSLDWVTLSKIQNGGHSDFRRRCPALWFWWVQPRFLTIVSFNKAVHVNNQWNWWKMTWNPREIEYFYPPGLRNLTRPTRGKQKKNSRFPPDSYEIIPGGKYSQTAHSILNISWKFHVDWMSSSDAMASIAEVTFVEKWKKQKNKHFAREFHGKKNNKHC